MEVPPQPVGEAPISQNGPVIFPQRPRTARILVVDDDRINRKVVENMLLKQNYTIAQAENGFKALELLESEPFDLVLLDIMMPHMSGYEVCRELRKSHGTQQLPVIFLTARDQDTAEAEAIASGGNDFLTKPITKSVLLERVSSHIEQSRGIGR